MQINGHYYLTPYDTDDQWNKMVDQISDSTTEDLRVPKMGGDEMTPEQQVESMAAIYTAGAIAKEANWIVDNYAKILQNANTLLDQFDDPRTWITPDIDPDSSINNIGGGMDLGNDFGPGGSGDDD